MGQQNEANGDEALKEIAIHCIMGFLIQEQTAIPEPSTDGLNELDKSIFDMLKLHKNALTIQQVAEKLHLYKWYAKWVVMNLVKKRYLNRGRHKNGNIMVTTVPRWPAYLDSDITSY